MIKANEVRNGNLIYDSSNSVRVVSHADELGKSMWFKRDGNTHPRYYSSLYNCTPIPLTEEWLLKFGFEWKGADHYENGEYWLEDYKGGYRFCRPNFCHVACKTVHQLQNLYFALTGEELTIKSGLSTEWIDGKPNLANL